MQSFHRSSSQKTFRVGIRWPAWANGFAYRLFEGLLDFQRTADAFELIFDHPSGYDLAARPVDEHWDGDGLLVFRHSLQEQRQWKKRGIAVVNLSTEFLGKAPAFPRVTADNQIVAQLVARHFASLGLKDFAYIHERNREYSRERLEAYRREISLLQGRLHVIELPVSSWKESIRSHRLHTELKKALARLPKPCGVFAKDDIMGYAALQAIKELGIRCPDELPLCGCGDDIAFCHTTWPALTSVDFPGKDIGFHAAQLLRRMMNGESISPETRILVPPTRLVARESTGRVVLPDAILTRALDCIRQSKSNESVVVSDLAKRVGVSREILRQRFQAGLGRSPKQEIERMRLNRVLHVLRNGSPTLSDVAERTGFSGSDELCRFIKRITGKTAGQLRKES